MTPRAGVSVFCLNFLDRHRFSSVYEYTTISNREPKNVLHHKLSSHQSHINSRLSTGGYIFTF